MNVCLYFNNGSTDSRYAFTSWLDIDVEPGRVGVAGAGSPC